MEDTDSLLAQIMSFITVVTPVVKKSKQLWVTMLVMISAYERSYCVRLRIQIGLDSESDFCQGPAALEAKTFELNLTRNASSRDAVQRGHHSTNAGYMVYRTFS